MKEKEALEASLRAISVQQQQPPPGEEEREGGTDTEHNATTCTQLCSIYYSVYF